MQGINNILKLDQHQELYLILQTQYPLHENYTPSYIIFSNDNLGYELDKKDLLIHPTLFFFICLVV